MTHTIITVPDQPVFTVGEIALLLKISPRIIGRLFDSHYMQGYRIGACQSARIHRHSLMQFINLQSQKIAYYRDDPAGTTYEARGLDDTGGVSATAATGVSLPTTRRHRRASLLTWLRSLLCRAVR